MSGSNFVRTIRRLAAGERERLGSSPISPGADLSEIDADLTSLALAAYLAVPCAGLYHLTASGETMCHGLARHVVEQAERRGAEFGLAGAVGTSDYPLPARRPANSVFETGTLPPRRDSCLLTGRGMWTGCLINYIQGERLRDTRRRHTCRRAGTRLHTATFGPDRYGIVEFDQDGKIPSLEEKPSVPQVALFRDGPIFARRAGIGFLRNLAPSSLGERESVDLNRLYIDDGTLNVEIMERTMPGSTRARTVHCARPVSSSPRSRSGKASMSRARSRLPIESRWNDPGQAPQAGRASAQERGYGN
ncbi:sugar nucleotide-binding protein [Rhizobium sp. SAFR-030]|uniref:sugar nucleotide-binding protein n=1 Tax=Rhizobium sp. SAFR-030 TaxID=3387277 RepID=UPI003F7DEE21